MIFGAGDTAVRTGVYVPESRRETRMPTTEAGRGLGPMLVCSVLVLLAVLGGVFLAAETDALPPGMQAFAHRAFGAPGTAVFGQRTKKQRLLAGTIASPAPAG